MAEFEVLTWNRMYSVLLSLARKILRSGFVPDVIVGVSRGGWIPARVLCDLLSVPVLANVGVEFYTGIGERKSQPKLTQPLSAAVSGKKVLIVDEVADTGESLKLAKGQVIKEGAKEARTVTMYTKLWSVIEPDYHGKKTACWIVFPWETKEAIRSIAAGSKWENRKELDDLEHARLTARQAQRFLNKILEERYQNHQTYAPQVFNTYFTEVRFWWRISSLFRHWFIVDALMFAIVFSFAAQICMFSVASKQNLVGVVYGADGPVAGAFVYASGSEGQGYGYTTTDGSGHYSLSKGLETGNYTVTVWAVGYMMGNTDNVQVTVGQPTTGINFDLQLSGAVSGTVTDAVSSNPLSGVIVVAYTAGGDFGWQAITDSNGKYYIATNLATGSYNITELFPEGHVAQSSMQAVTAGAEVKNVNLVLPRSGIISGRITTPGGTPLNDVTIMASSAGGLGYTTTNATGDYRISSGLGTDTYFVMAIASGGGLGGMNSTPSVSVTAGLETSGVDMELSVTPPSPSGIITGQVTDVSTGKPIMDASVNATGPGGGSGTASTDSNGDYTISSGLGTTGSYNVTASAPGYQDQLKTGVSVTVGAVTPGVDFQLSISSAQSGTITGTVIGAPGAVPEFQYPIAVVLSLTLVVAAASRLFQRTKRSQNARNLR